MYQTVGQDAIHLVAQALEVPLYRRTIKGTAVNQDLEYGSRESTTMINNEDETEDLYALLSTVKVLHHLSITSASTDNELTCRKIIRILQEFQSVLYFRIISVLGWNMYANAFS